MFQLHVVLSAVSVEQQVVQRYRITATMGDKKTRLPDLHISLST